METSEKKNKKKTTHKKSTIIWEGQDKPKAAKERHYVDNKAFYAALVERRKEVSHAEDQDKSPPPVSNFIGECILQIANNLAKKHQFNNYKYKDEMISDAILSCMKGVDKFDPEKSKNPFAYFTQTCYYAFISRISNEKKQTYIKCKTTQDALTSGEMADVSGGESEVASHVMDNMEFPQDYMEGFIKDYEEKKNISGNKKKKRNIKKQSLERFYT